MDENVQEKGISSEKDNPMQSIKTYNKISEDGLKILQDAGFTVSPEEQSPSAIVLRSHKLSETEIGDSTLAIGRAGAGVNNIPVDYCTDKGIVVFNSPGANANAVKELVLSALFVTSRNLVEGVTYTKTLDPSAEDFHQKVEKSKSQFKGAELRNKSIGIIGLGAIGMMVANAAVALGMKVQGYDPYITVNNAWGLSSQVKRAEDLKQLVSSCDFLTVHMPLTQKTKSFVDHDLLQHAKPGSVLLNFSRAEIVNESDITKALDAGNIARYLTDFPSPSLIQREDVLCLPHLGASTQEAENNCAVMIGNQLSDYLINGNIVNAVNFPACGQQRQGEARLCIMNKNVPNMVGQITALIAEHEINIIELLNKSRDDYAYNIIDLAQMPNDGLVDQIKAIDGVLTLRVL